MESGHQEVADRLEQYEGLSLSCSSLLFYSSSLCLLTADFQAKHGRDTGLGCEDWEEYKQMVGLSDLSSLILKVWTN